MQVNTHITVDVVVVGTGAGGLTAAITASELGTDVLLIEKSSRYGGTSAMSGGCVWIPDNSLMREAGMQDSQDDALRYLGALTKGRVSESRLVTAAREGAAMIDFLQRRASMRFAIVPDYTDYYPNEPGAKSGGRTLEVSPFDGRELGAWLPQLRESHPQMLFLERLALTFPESKLAMHRGAGWATLMARRLGAYYGDVRARLGKARDRRLCLGAALVGRLAANVIARGIPIRLETSFRDFIRTESGVGGIIASRRNEQLSIRARHGVIMATGGFEHNQVLREKYLPAPTSAEWSAASRENTGDGIAAGIAIGAATDFMSEAWWGPTNPSVGGDGRPAFMCVTERAVPGGIIVNRDGVRVVNESAPYCDIVRAMYRTRDASGAPSVPLFLIVDATFRKRFNLGPVMPWQSDAVLTESTPANQGIVKAATLEQLAGKLGVAWAALARTVESHNHSCRTGRDRQFARGESAYDRFWSDPKYGSNPCLGPIGKPPFYALRLFPGDIGTRGGLLVDQHWRVLGSDGAVIPGLYAIGNCAAPVYGDSYPGAGATLGAAMTGGYVAAQAVHAGIQQERERRPPCSASLSRNGAVSC